MEDLDVKTLIWRMFMIVTQQATVHLGNDFLETLHSTKKPATKNGETIVRCDEKVGQRSERNSRYFHDQLARKFLEQDDSVDWPSSSVINSESLCILRFSIVHGKNQWTSRKGREGENRFVYEFICCRELDRIDREPMEFEWKNFPGFATLQILAEIQNMMTEIQCEPEQFPGRIIFMPMKRKRKRRMVYCEFPNRSRMCKKIRARTLGLD